MRKLITLIVRKLYKKFSIIDNLTNEYKKIQFLSENELRNFQRKRFEELLTHCKKNVSYYREFLDTYDEKSFKNFDIKSLPILTKDILRNKFNELKSDDLHSRDWMINSSGGSTGEPVKIIQDTYYSYHSEARKNICFQWAGLKTGDNLIKLWGSERDILGTNRLLDKIKNFLKNEIILNAFILSHPIMKKFIKIFNSSKPSVILAYVNAIYELSNFAKNEDIKVSHQKSVISTSGVLYPFLRKEIEMIFGCEVYDQYGSREVSCIASECEYHNGLHISEETIILEIVDENGNECPVGVEGDVLVTSLVNYAMPIMRYKIGDRAIMERGFCKCGRFHKRLKNVVGRSMDNFKLRDGTIIPSEYFIHFIGVVLNRGILKKIQIIQKSYDVIDLHVVYSNEEILSEDIQNIIQAVKKVMGENCTVNIHEKENIAPNSSGKYRYTICEL